VKINAKGNRFGAKVSARGTQSASCLVLSPGGRHINVLSAIVYIIAVNASFIKC
jgi:hypothetical protein